MALTFFVLFSVAWLVLFLAASASAQRIALLAPVDSGESFDQILYANTNAAPAVMPQLMSVICRNGVRIALSQTGLYGGDALTLAIVLDDGCLTGNYSLITEQVANFAALNIAVN